MCHFLLKYINRLHQYSRTVHSSPFWPHPEQHMGEDSLLRKYSRQNVLNLCWHNKTFIGQKDNILSLKKPHRKDKSQMTSLKYPNCFSLTAMRFSEKQFSSLLLDFFFFVRTEIPFFQKISQQFLKMTSKHLMSNSFETLKWSWLCDPHSFNILILLTVC